MMNPDLNRVDDIGRAAGVQEAHSGSLRRPARPGPPRPAPGPAGRPGPGRGLTRRDAASTAAPCPPPSTARLRQRRPRRAATHGHRRVRAGGSRVPARDTPRGPPASGRARGGDLLAGRIPRAHQRGQGSVPGDRDVDRACGDRRGSGDGGAGRAPHRRREMRASRTFCSSTNLALRGCPRRRSPTSRRRPSGWPGRCASGRAGPRGLEWEPPAVVPGVSRNVCAGQEADAPDRHQRRPAAPPTTPVLMPTRSGRGQLQAQSLYSAAAPRDVIGYFAPRRSVSRLFGAGKGPEVKGGAGRRDWLCFLAASLYARRALSWPSIAVRTASNDRWHFFRHSLEHPKCSLIDSGSRATGVRDQQVGLAQDEGGRLADAADELAGAAALSVSPFGERRTAGAGPRRGPPAGSRRAPGPTPTSLGFAPACAAPRGRPTAACCRQARTGRCGERGPRDPSSPTGPWPSGRPRGSACPGHAHAGPPRQGTRPRGGDLLGGRVPGAHERGQWLIARDGHVDRPEDSPRAGQRRPSGERRRPNRRGGVPPACSGAARGWRCSVCRRRRSTQARTSPLDSGGWSPKCSRASPGPWCREGWTRAACRHRRTARRSIPRIATPAGAPHLDAGAHPAAVAPARAGADLVLALPLPRVLVGRLRRIALQWKALVVLRGPCRLSRAGHRHAERVEGPGRVVVRLRGLVLVVPRALEGLVERLATVLALLVQRAIVVVDENDRRGVAGLEGHQVGVAVFGRGLFLQTPHELAGPADLSGSPSKGGIGRGTSWARAGAAHRPKTGTRARLGTTRRGLNMFVSLRPPPGRASALHVSRGGNVSSRGIRAAWCQRARTARCAGAAGPGSRPRPR